MSMYSIAYFMCSRLLAIFALNVVHTHTCIYGFCKVMDNFYVSVCVL